MGLAIGLGIAPTLGQGVGVSWPVATPTIAVVEPVTNPPAFDIGLDVVGGDAVQVGDVIRLRIDGNTTHDSDALDAADLIAGEIEIANGTLTAGAHTAEVAVFRSAVQVSAWSSVDTFEITVDLARFDSSTVKFDSTAHKFDEAA